MFSDLLVSGLVFGTIDYQYLKIVKPHFSELIKNIQGTELELDYDATLLAYVSLILGLWYLIIRNNRSIQDAVILGVAIYSVFGLTNKAIIKDWTWKTVAMDSIWGGILYGLTTIIVYKIKEVINEEELLL